MGSYCPAEMILKCDREEGSCRVEYQKIHLGHEVGCESELQHIYLEKQDKLEIASQVQEGVPVERILKRQCLSNDSDDGKTWLKIVTKDDIRNVLKSYAVEEPQSAVVGHPPVEDAHPPAESRSTAISDVQSMDNSTSLASDTMDSLVARNKDSILYYKDTGKADTKFQILGDDDFMVVIMSGEQGDNLRRHGHRIVAMDGARGTKPGSYVLHTMLVVDTDYEGVPVAFALTNRSDGDAVSVFLTCVRENVGIVQTKTFLSDTLLTYAGCWESVMVRPERIYYCTWHVYDSWKRSFPKISNWKKRITVSKRVHEMAQEPDEILFREKLESLLAARDAELESFLNHFETYYAECPEKWALCYREVVETNANNHLENFFRLLRRSVADEKALTCLRFVLEYLVAIEYDNQLRRIRGKITTKLRNLRARHRAAVVEGMVVIERIDGQNWQVSSHGRTEDLVQELNVVSKLEEKECSLREETCRLPCTLCRICFHEYRCSCRDSSVANNMCKHIHALGLFLQYQDSWLDALGENVVVNLSDLDSRAWIANAMDGLADEKTMIEETQIEETETKVTPTEEKQTDEDVTQGQELEEARKRLIDKFCRSLSSARTCIDIQEIERRFVDPIESALASLHEEKELQEFLQTTNL